MGTTPSTFRNANCYDRRSWLGTISVVVLVGGTGATVSPAYAVCTGVNTATVDCSGTDTASVATTFAGNVTNTLTNWTLTGGRFSTVVTGGFNNALTAANTSITAAGTTPAEGMVVTSDTGDVSVTTTGGAITTSAAQSYANAIRASAGGAGTVTVDNSSTLQLVSASAYRALLAYTTGTGDVAVTNSGSITTQNGAGLSAGSTSGNVVVNNSGNLTRLSSAAISWQNIIAFSSHDVTVNLTGGTLINPGPNGTGIQVFAVGTGTGTVNMTGGSIHSGIDGIDVLNDNGFGSVTFESLVTASGSAIAALRATTAAGTSIVSDNAAGIKVGTNSGTRGGSAAQGSSMTVDSQSDITAGSQGIWAASISDAPVTITQTGGSITSGTAGSSGVGIQASTAGAINVANSGTITTSGANAHGIMAAAAFTSATPMTTTITGPVGVSNSGAIQTQGASSNGIYATTSNLARLAGAAGDVTVTNSNAITTSGATSNGILARTLSYGAGAGGNVTVVNDAGGNIATSGDASNAIQAGMQKLLSGPAGAINVTNAAMLTTSGASANGISVSGTGTSSGPITVANSGPIVTQGTGANGIQATAVAGGNMSIDNRGPIASTLANGIFASSTGDPTFALANEASGSVFGTTGVALSGTFDPAQIDNAGTIGASTDLAIDSSGLTTGALTINNSGTITGFVTLGAGVNTVNNTGQWNLRNFNSTAGTLGVAVSDLGTSGANVINNTGTLALLGQSGAAVDSTAQYLPLGNTVNAMAVDGPVQGQILGAQTFENAGVIDLTANPAVGDVLLISGGHTAGADGGGVFATNGGTVRFNTVLNEGGANSQSDMLVVDSTRLGSGATGLAVTNAGGAGAMTEGNGIALVEVLNKSVSAAGAFTLSGPVEAGAYQYLLYQGGLGADAANGNWYLRSFFEEPCNGGNGGGNGGVCNGGQPGPSPEPGPVAWRPGVVAYTMTPLLNLGYGFSILGTLHQRVGDVPGAIDPQQNTAANGVWGRVDAQSFDADALGRFGANSTTYFAQFGKDWTLERPKDGGSTHAGVTATLGNTSATFHDSLRAIAGLDTQTGTVSTQAWSLGGYWTRYLKDGTYFDSVGQLTYYHNRFGGLDGSASQNGVGAVLSQEVGKPFQIGSTPIAIEPQAQLMYQYLSLGDFGDAISPVLGTHTNALRGRAGFRLFGVNLPNSDDHNPLSWAKPYLTFNVLHDFFRPGQTVVGDTAFNPMLSRTWYDVGAGVTAAAGKHGELYAHGGYQHNLGSGYSRGFYGQLAYRYMW